MSTPVFSLQYVATADDLRAAFRRMRREYERSWFRFGSALFMGWFAFKSITAGYGWLATLFTTLATIYLRLPTPPLMWLFYVWTLKRYSDLEVSVEIDERSLVTLTPNQGYGYRKHWSRLTRVGESELGFELFFDGESVASAQIPFKAFVDDAQCDEFRQFLRQHAPEKTEWRILNCEQW